MVRARISGGGRNKVIPPGWAEHHRPVANATMTATGTIVRDEGPPKTWPAPPFNERVLVQCEFRVQELKRELSPMPGGQPTEVRQYLITMPLALAPADLRVGDEGDNVLVVGRRFQIKQKMAGSLLWEMDLICTENQTQQGA